MSDIQRRIATTIGLSVSEEMADVELIYSMQLRLQGENKKRSEIRDCKKI